ncbi:hypothetical protein SprV_0802518100 [Sparganum proliferum]
MSAEAIEEDDGEDLTGDVEQRDVSALRSALKQEFNIDTSKVESHVVKTVWKDGKPQSILVILLLTIFRRKEVDCLSRKRRF